MNQLDGLTCSNSDENTKDTIWKTQQQNGKLWAGQFGSGQEPRYEYGNEHAGSTKGAGFLMMDSDCMVWVIPFITDRENNLDFTTF